MTDKLIGGDGRPIAPPLTTVAKINHCGACAHAILLAQPDGKFNFKTRTCLEGPPQYVQMPVMRQTLQGPQVVGMQAVWTYPEVGLTMRACSRFEEKTAQDRNVEQFDSENAHAEIPMEQQKKN